MNETLTNETLTKASQVKLVVFDVDGVLSNGQLYFSNGGEELKAFYVQDGLGINYFILRVLKQLLLQAVLPTLLKIEP